MTTTKETIKGSKHFRNCDFYAILPFRSRSTMLEKFATTGMQGAKLKYRQRIIEIYSCRLHRVFGNFTLLFYRERHGIRHIRILTVVLETGMKERLVRGNHFKCKSLPPHEPPSHARSSPTVRIRIRSIILKCVLHVHHAYCSSFDQSHS